jgi:hypothetical protein
MRWRSVCAAMRRGCVCAMTPVNAATDLETDLWQLRALAAARRAADDDDRMRSDRGRDLGPLRMNRQAFVVLNGGHGPASPLGTRDGRPLAFVQPSALFAAAHSASSSVESDVGRLQTAGLQRRLDVPEATLELGIRRRAARPRHRGRAGARPERD